MKTGISRAIDIHKLKNFTERLRFDKKEINGIVFNIQKFSIHDGPGFRTTVFLKGCPLKCLWCSNPESHYPHPQITRNFNLCNNCYRCLEACDRNAIRVVNPVIVKTDAGCTKHTIIHHPDKCNNCLRCVEVCPSDAIFVTGEILSVNEVIKKVEQDRPFYETSGGGVTLSGGEPLSQPEFTTAILKESKEKGIHTALDTCGMAPQSILKELLPFVNLVMYDIKHIDPEKHFTGTGVDNGIILKNLEYINGKVELWLRIPLIPNFNDDDETIQEIFYLARKIRIKKLSFLIYHEWGRGKYRGLGKIYPLEGSCPISEERLNFVRELASSQKYSSFEIEISSF